MRLYIFLFVCFFTSHASGQSTTLTLEDCLRMAFENNLDIRQSGYDFETAKVNLLESKFARLPNLNFSAGGSVFSGRVVDPTTNDFITESFISNDIALNSNIIIYNGGRLNAQVKASKINKDIAAQQAEAVRDNVGLQVINTFLNVVLAQENLANNRSMAELTDSQLEQLKIQVDAGTRPANDLLNLEVQRAQDEQNIIATQNELEIGLLQLKQLLRYEGDADLILEAPELDMTLMAMGDDYNFQQVYAAALETMPAIKAAELGSEAALTQEKMARSGLLPSLSANALLNTRYSDAAQNFSVDTVWQPIPFRLNGQMANVELLQFVPTSDGTIPLQDQWDQNLGYGVGLNLSVPLFNRWTARSSIQRAKIEKESADLRLEQARDNLKLDIQNALASARAAYSNYQAAQRTLQLSQTAFENSSNSYEVGAVNVFDLNQARLNFDNAQRSVLSSKYNYIFRIKVLDFYLGRKINF